ETLGYQQASRRRVPTIGFDDVVRDVTRSIRAAGRTPAVLKAYSETGLRLSSCEILSQHIAENTELLQRLFRERRAVGELIEVVVNACLLLREMQSDREVAASPIELIQAWTAGSDVV